MRWEIVAAAVLLLGAILLTVGPALQALYELSPYNDILEQSPLVDSFTDTLPKWIRVALNLPLGPFSGVTPAIVEGAGRILRGLLWVQQERAKLATIQDQKEYDEWKDYLDRMGRALTIARNWLVVTFGATIVCIGATIELAIRIWVPEG